MLEGIQKLTPCGPASDDGPSSRYEALFAVSQAISAHRDQNELFEILTTQLHRVVEFDRLIVLIWQEELHKWKKHTFAIDSSDDISSPEFDPEETISWHVYQTQDALAIPFLKEETRFPRVIEYLTSHKLESMCLFPLTTVLRNVGVLAFASKKPDAYSQEEMCFLSLVASEVALSLDNALNFEDSEKAKQDLQNEHERLKLLLDLTNTVVSKLELRDVLRSISSNLRQVMHCAAVGVYMPESDNKHVRLYALDFPAGKGLLKEEWLLPIEGSYTGRTLITGKPLMVDHLDPKFMKPEVYQILVNEGVKSCCFLPLHGHDRTLGVLAFGIADENSFTDEQLDFLVQVSNQVAIAVENALAYRQIEVLKDRLAQEKLYLEDEIRTEMNFEEIVGDSTSLRQVLQQVETVAPTDSTVLILGETGTGKELVARALHNRSRRKDRTFVKLNCAAIPTGLLESELFGHEKGAFTGAISQRVGRVELANHGTLFLDEVGDIPLELQSKLLRVLQEREFERLGSTTTKQVDVRLIAATNRDLQKMIADHEFRSDLYYRLNVFPIRIPPLRERPDDIPLLVRHFTQKYARRMERRIETIPSHAMKMLMEWHWPGNVRELENFIERAVILTTNQVLNVPLSELHTGEQNKPAPIQSEFGEREKIVRILKDTKGRVGGPDGAAIRLGLKRTTLIARMKKLGIDPKELS
jgi:formate hydrogenlyase transcriptional activator